MSKSARKARRTAAAQEAAEAAAAAAAQGEAQIVELTVVEETTVVEEVALVEETPAAEVTVADEAATDDTVAEEAVPAEGEAVPVDGEATPAEGAPSEDAAVVVELPPEELRAQALRVVEAMIFASSEALSVKEIAKRLPKGVDVAGIVDEIETHYAARGVNLVRVAGKLAFRTASDVAEKLKIERVVARKLSKAATETLAIVAYQTAEGRPVTRAEI